MGNSSGMEASDSAASAGGGLPHGHGGDAKKVQVTLEDLELPPRRVGKPGSVAAALGQAAQAGGGALAAMGGGGGNASVLGALAAQAITEEIIPGGEPKGSRAFKDDGLVGTGGQQLQLLAHYAELCEDFRLYQRYTRAEGAPQTSDGAQLLLLSGPPGTGKTRHAVSFARALGLPLLMATPPGGGGSSAPKSAAGWATQIRREVNGRDCIIFFDEIDHHVKEDGFASTIRQFLDGVCQPLDSKVLLVGTTNQLDKIPKDVVHRAEVVRFHKPEATHLEEMWSSFAQHLKEDDLRELATVSQRVGATGRDVRHCATLCERRGAIGYLNEQNKLGYCHGAALANCPTPPLAEYVQCVRNRMPE